MPALQSEARYEKIWVKSQKGGRARCCDHLLGSEGRSPCFR